MQIDTWCCPFFCYDNDLRVGHGRNLSGVRVDFANVEYAGLNRFFTYTKILENISGYLFLCRTYCELEYVRNLDQVTAEILEVWRSRLMVSNEAVLLTKPCA